MIPILASGAASLASVLVNRAAGASATSSGNVTLDSKAFEKALNRAVGNRRLQSPAEQQASALGQQFARRPEVEAALAVHPVGSVSSMEIRADGSLSLRTSQGVVPVQLSQESRQMAQALYAASSVQAASAMNSQSAPSLDAPLVIPVQQTALR